MYFFNEEFSLKREKVPISLIHQRKRCCNKRTLPEKAPKCYDLLVKHAGFIIVRTSFSYVARIFFSTHFFSCLLFKGDHSDFIVVEMRGGRYKKIVYLPRLD